MILYREPFPKTDLNISAVALGTFDGVHTGHRAVINEALRYAKERGGLCAVWCFAEPPRSFFSHDEVKLILSKEEKIRAMEKLGVDVLIMPELSSELLSVTAEDFMHSLENSLHASHIVCGFNYSFGADAAGTVETLAQYFHKRGVSVTVVPAVKNSDGRPISSTLIRKLIESGRSADEFLGK